MLGAMLLVQSRTTVSEPLETRTPRLSLNPCTDDPNAPITGITELKPNSVELDRWIQEDMSELNAEEGLHAWASWCDGGNALAQGDDHIFLGRELFAAVEAETNVAEDRRRTILDFILGHEYTHLLQEHLNITPGTGTVRERELQADEGGGAWVWLRLRGALPSADATWPMDDDQAVSFAFSIGDRRWDDPSTHGTPSERASAFRLGFILANAHVVNGYRPGAEDGAHFIANEIVDNSVMSPDLAAEMEARDKTWNDFLKHVQGALTEGGDLPVAPGAVPPVRLKDGSHAYVFPIDSSTLGHEAPIAAWDDLSQHIDSIFSGWPGEVEMDLDKSAAIRTLDSGRAREAVSASRITTTNIIFWQESIVGGVRISMSRLTGSNQIGIHNWVVLVVSATWLSDDARQKAERQNTNRVQMLQVADKSIRDQLDAESMSLASARETFLGNLAHITATAGTTGDMMKELDAEALPPGVTVAARSWDSVTFLLTDTNDHGLTAGQWSYHVVGMATSQPVKYYINFDPSFDLFHYVKDHVVLPSMKTYAPTIKDADIFDPSNANAHRWPRMCYLEEKVGASRDIAALSVFWYTPD
jgi:hypothetical protein